MARIYEFPDHHRLIELPETLEEALAVLEDLYEFDVTITETSRVLKLYPEDET